MEQVMLLDTPKYLYSLGAIGAWWVVVRYDRQESTGTNQWPKDYKPEEFDSWM